MLIEGRLRLDQWDDKQTGQKRSRLGSCSKASSSLIPAALTNAGPAGARAAAAPAAAAAAAAPAAGGAETGRPRRRRRAVLSPAPRPSCPRQLQLSTLTTFHMAKTEVILTHNIVGLGGESDQVKVAAGYARNYLFPQGLAIPLTGANKRRLEVLRQRRAEREAHEFNTMTELAKSVSKLHRA